VLKAEKTAMCTSLCAQKSSQKRSGVVRAHEFQVVGRGLLSARQRPWQHVGLFFLSCTTLQEHVT
jgi:hypothetical protein